jgi:hypothetical protein
MDIVQRVKNICLTPNTEWPVIAGETTDAKTLITGYAVPLVAIGVVAGFVGRSLVGVSLPFIGYYRVSIVAGLVAAVFTFVMAIVGVFILSLIIDALAPSFGGEKNKMQALKVAVYSYTPAWVAGALLILPALSPLVVLASLYGLYLLYLALPSLMKAPQDKAVGYTVVVVICAIVLAVVIGAIGAMFVGAGMVGTGVLTSAMRGDGAASAASEVHFDKNSPLGKLEEMGKKLEQSTKKMDAAEKRGDQGGQVAAAMEGLGTLFGGGKHVDPIGIDQLKPFVPETFAGLPKKSSNAEKTGIAALMVSKAEATYGDGAQKSVTLQISDTGGVSGLVGLAGWVGVQEEKDDDNVSERTRKVDGRLVHEKISKTGGDNEFGVVLGDRFVVSATGRGVGLDQLKSAIGTIDLVKLESMKNVGVTK